MDIISYRGPGAAGGVSTGLGAVWHASETRSDWWHLDKNDICKRTKQHPDPGVTAQVGDDIIEGHYRYCNEFLWPIMHDLPKFAHYKPVDRAHYKAFNTAMARAIVSQQARPQYFLQDYQLSLVAGLLNKTGSQCTIFWHIPWPASVRSEHLEGIKEVAKGLLCNAVIGFHTAEYADNFCTFVETYLPECCVDTTSNVVGINSKTVDSTSKTRPTSKAVYSIQRHAWHKTEVVAHPLGIDSEKWQSLSMAESTTNDHRKLRYILSVDRADYSKSVVERLRLVDQFFSRYPHYIGTIQFVQVCNRTRVGLPAFDAYWSECKRHYEIVNARWATADWQPVQWIETPLPASELAIMYRDATAMLITPIRDGLNLTAKEFAACQTADPGVLLLSPGAGAWQELRGAALSAHPEESETVEALAYALGMPEGERKVRLEMLNRQVRKNSMDDWWTRFTSDVPAAARQTKQLA